jgi:outer membrane protein assembly factor BamB
MRTLCLLPLLSLLALAEPNWPGWRGPAGNGVAQEPNVPWEWSGEKNVAWKVALPGRGNSSPAVWGNHLFLTAHIEGDVVPGVKAPPHKLGGESFRHPDSRGADRQHQLLVLAIDTRTGKILWQKPAYEGVIYDDYHKKGSYASPTPVTDGKSVFAYFGTAGLYVFDFAGKLQWKTEPLKLGTIGMGPGTSPVLYENLVILQCDQEEGEGSFVQALDKRTGKPVWRVDRKSPVTWSTPLLIKAKEREELLTSASDFVIAYDPRTGKELWRGPGLTDLTVVNTPVEGQGMVFASAGYPKKLTRAYRAGGSGEVKPVWSYEKGTAYVPSPVLLGDYLYLTTDGGVLTCLDAKTGAVKYDNGRMPKPGRVSASLLAVGDRILLTTEPGDTYLIKAGPTFEILATNSLGEDVYSSLAVAQGSLFIRGAKHLYCIRQ